MQRFPTVADLAAADLQEVLRLWEGLGYYRRAGQLHAAARQIVIQHAGKFPERFEDVLALPGVGRYTAGAVLSISAGQPWPILEGNTIRLYSRLLGMRGDPTNSANQRLLWQFAQSLVPQCRPGQFNQGLMEIGGLICRPAQPNCPKCPLQRQCAAKQHGWQEQIPAPRLRKTRWESRVECVVLLEWRGNLLGRVVPPGERWAGLWDFPRFDIGWLFPEPQLDSDEPLPSRVLQWLAEVSTEEFGIKTTLKPHPETIRHGVTRFRIQLGCAEGHVVNGRLKKTAVSAGWQWLPVDHWTKHPLNVTARQILDRHLSSANER
jgi:A/G-specific adenine glycosylase